MVLFATKNYALLFSENINDLNALGKNNQLIFQEEIQIGKVCRESILQKMVNQVSFDILERTRKSFVQLSYVRQMVLLRFQLVLPSNECVYNARLDALMTFQKHIVLSSIKNFVQSLYALCFVKNELQKGKERRESVREIQF